MRFLVVVLFVFASPCFSAASEDPSSIQRLIEAGAIELALNRIDALQPPSSKSPGWADWEGLRCEVLARLDRHEQLLPRANAIAPEAANPQLNVCLVEGARAALTENAPQIARSLAGRALWQRTLSAAHVRIARLVAIESYLLERRGEDAFRSMLRFQQDYQPLDRATTQRFAEGLLDLGLDREALNWLGRTDEVTPGRLRLQLRSGTLAPEAVIAQARAALARNPEPGYWRAIHEAAIRLANPSVVIEALERQLQLAGARDVRTLSEQAERLWQAYIAAAVEIGNREQLLVGDEGAWADHAARRLASNPALSRAFYGYLAHRAQNPDMRRNAQLQLIFSLSSAGLDNTALHLARHSVFAIDALDAQTRYLLGTLAANRNEPALALKYWDGLATPPSLSPDAWQFTRAEVALRAGETEIAMGALQRLLSSRKSLPPELAQSALRLAQDMLDRRELDAAQTAYELLIPLSSGSRARDALLGLARALELNDEPAAAASAYLRAAQLQGQPPDAPAVQARLSAAHNLVRAGYKSDAKAQFEWLLKNSKDPAVLEVARRGAKSL